MCRAGEAPPKFTAWVNYPRPEGRGLLSLCPGSKPRRSRRGASGIPVGPDGQTPCRAGEPAPCVTHHASRRGGSGIPAESAARLQEADLRSDMLQKPRISGCKAPVTRYTYNLRKQGCPLGGKGRKGLVSGVSVPSNEVFEEAHGHFYGGEHEEHLSVRSR